MCWGVGTEGTRLLKGNVEVVGGILKDQSPRQGHTLALIGLEARC